MTVIYYGFYEKTMTLPTGSRRRAATASLAAMHLLREQRGLFFLGYIGVDMRNCEPVLLYFIVTTCFRNPPPTKALHKLVHFRDDFYASLTLPPINNGPKKETLKTMYTGESEHDCPVLIEFAKEIRQIAEFVAQGRSRQLEHIEQLVDKKKHHKHPKRTNLAYTLHDLCNGVMVRFRELLLIDTEYRQYQPTTSGVQEIFDEIVVPWALSDSKL